MTKSTPNWVECSAACKYLCCCASTLYKYRKEGIFKAGTHWRLKFPTSKKSGILYNLPACEETLINLSSTNAKTLELAQGS